MGLFDSNKIKVYVTVDAATLIARADRLAEVFLRSLDLTESEASFAVDNVGGISLSRTDTPYSSTRVEIASQDGALRAIRDALDAICRAVADDAQLKDAGIPAPFPDQMYPHRAVARPSTGGRMTWGFYFGVRLKMLSGRDYALVRGADIKVDVEDTGELRKIDCSWRPILKAVKVKRSSIFVGTTGSRKTPYATMTDKTSDGTSTLDENEFAYEYVFDPNERNIVPVVAYRTFQGTVRIPASPEICDNYVFNG